LKKKEKKKALTKLGCDDFFFKKYFSQKNGETSRHKKKKRKKEKAMIKVANKTTPFPRTHSLSSEEDPVMIHLGSENYHVCLLPKNKHKTNISSSE